MHAIKGTTIREKFIPELISEHWNAAFEWVEKVRAYEESDIISKLIINNSLKK